jgi:hypothetical protein
MHTLVFPAVKTIGLASSDDDNDKDYVPRKPRQLSESPIRPYAIDEDGHEIVESEDDLLSHKVSPYHVTLNHSVY